MERNQTSKTVNAKGEKYLAQKFNREYNGTMKELLPDNIKQLNYLRYKEFLAKIGFTSDNADTPESTERALLFDLWRILKGEANDEIHIEDLRVMVLAVLRMTEHKRIGVSAPDD